MRDALAALLGASDGGLLKYSYLTVRMVAHSCSTVAGADLVGRAVMTALFQDGPGDATRDRRAHGSTGCGGSLGCHRADIDLDYRFGIGVCFVRLNLLHSRRSSF